MVVRALNPSCEINPSFEGLATMEERILWFVLIATIVWALVMAAEASSFDKSHSSGLVGRFDSPIAMLELASSQQLVAEVLDQGPRQKNIRIMRINTYMDFIFIVLYCLTLILLAAVCSSTSTLTRVVEGLVIATGVLDYWENFRLLGLFKMMESGVATQTPLSRPLSLAKWTFFALDLAIVGYALLQAKTRIGSPALLAIAAFVFLASGLTVVGLFQNRIIGASVLCLFPALLIAAWFWKP